MILFIAWSCIATALFSLSYLFLLYTESRFKRRFFGSFRGYLDRLIADSVRLLSPYARTVGKTEENIIGSVSESFFRATRRYRVMKTGVSDIRTVSVSRVSPYLRELADRKGRS